MTAPSPMSTPELFDRLVLITSKNQRIVLPGIPIIKVSREARDDSLDAAGQSGEVVTHFGDDTAQVSIEFTMHAASQYREFVALLKVLRVSAKGEPLTYTAVHPVLQAHGIRQLRHVKTQDSGYTSMQGYKVSFDFTEYYKPKQGTVVQTGTEAQTDAATGVPPAAPTGATPPDLTNVGAKGKAVYAAGVVGLVTGPSEPSQCSAWVREAYQGKAGAYPGASRALFGGSALATSRNFTAAGLARPYSQIGFSGLKAGDLVFYDLDRSGFGHVGIYDGKGGVMGNNLLTYRNNGGQLDPKTGLPTGFDKFGNKVDARGTQPIDSLGTPTGVGRLDGFAGTPAAKPFIGPVRPFTPAITPPAVPKRPAL